MQMGRVPPHNLINQRDEYLSLGGSIWNPLLLEIVGTIFQRRFSL